MIRGPPSPRGGCVRTVHVDVCHVAARCEPDVSMARATVQHHFRRMDRRTARLMHPRSDAMLANPSMTCGARNSPSPSCCDATAHGRRQFKYDTSKNHTKERGLDEAYVAVVRCDDTWSTSMQVRFDQKPQERTWSGEANVALVGCDAMPGGACNCKRAVAPLSQRTRFPMCVLAKMWPHVAFHNADPMRPFQDATPTEMTLACCPSHKASRVFGMYS